MLTSSENLLKVLSATNPWWKTGRISGDYAKPVKRFAYFDTLKLLKHPDIRRMALLTGARRIGKTTIMYQLIESLLGDGVAPNRIVYISFDHPLLKLCRFDLILDVFRQNIYPDDDAYYFFDEIQYTGDWDAWLKTLYDTNPSCRAVATGSASPILVDKASESGVGRWTTLQIPTLSFYEYCELLGVEQPELKPELKQSGLRDLPQHEQTILFQKLSPLQRYLNRYLTVGGVPELALSKDEFFAQRVMRDDVVDKVLKRDIPALYNIRSIVDLEKIFLCLCYNSSNIISMEAISKELEGVTRPTVEKYIQYLESANLIYTSNPIDLSGKKVLKSQPKIYIADAAIRNAVIMQEDILTNPTEMGIIAETAVYKHVRAFYYRLTANVGYSRGKGKGKENEIDIVVDYLKNRMLIEVKFREQYSLGDVSLIASEAENASSALLITKRDDDFGPLQTRPAVYRIPAYAFLYLLGHAEKYGYKDTQKLPLEDTTVDAVSGATVTSKAYLKAIENAFMP
jgi:predicted AAA+ superfamily ATPase